MVHIKKKKKKNLKKKIALVKGSGFQSARI